jgi:hypothetical protein
VKGKDEMVIVRIIGGLGNQMFMYAAGRKLAHVLAVELKLDVKGFETYKLRKYRLGSFNIQEKFASAEEVAALIRPGFVERLRRTRRPAGTYIRYIREKHFHFDPDILILKDGVYLDGYWQSEKYFADVAGIIRQEFTVKTPQTDENKALARQMASCQSVCLSIRRGDYVTNPKTNQFHGTCDMEYYRACVSHLTRTVKEPHFFVFSDELQWARANLRLPYPVTFVDHNRDRPNQPNQDMRLMSQCKHHIIANSTFPWWGAWLSPNPDKLVLAPKRWLNTDKHNTKDLIPDGWIRR